ncbi:MULTISPECIES: DUF3040 domain-containing protein [unclassified Streptomyces]|uniref:DUF3040 domain-containing protein n=1 Tax=unclassified Streptomyces TaxID=2593676 RepID=UPI0029B0E670|nr:DUF3040 domain-containing protein [Streptomyces sp. DK15]MDX2389253.1 DUF3040 domain-containing protein [Streptomyces sp. DK15]
MAGTDDGPLRDPATTTARTDPRFGHALNAGHPRRPLEHRRGRAWTLLTVALVTLTVGVMLPHGLLLAAGLVMAGEAVGLLDPPPGRERRT